MMRSPTRSRCARCAVLRRPLAQVPERAASTAGGVSVAGILFVALPALTIVLALVAALSVAALYQSRQRYEDALARTYNGEVTVREARAAARLELATSRVPTDGSAARRRASADRRRAESAARAAVRYDPVSVRLLRRQLSAQRRARSVLVATRRPTPRARERVAAALGAADDAAASLVQRQRRLQSDARDLAQRESRDALLRSSIAGGLALGASLLLVWLLLRSMHGPLAGLVSASGRLAADRLAARVEPRGPTEIRRLGEAFNAMAARLEARQAELQGALVRAEQANSAKMRFLSRMSHELRTPLNAILGFSQLLETEDLSPRQQESVAQVVAAGRHLLVLVDNVLEISQTDSIPRTSSEPVDVAEVVRDVVATTRHLADKQGISVALELPDGRPVVARADRDALRNVLLHLVSNAIKYNRKGGHVRITGSEDERRVQVVVADTGRGIPEDELEKVFVPFERLGADEAGIDGMGIGLALSERHVRAMDGTLEVTSELGTGTRFTLALPVSDARNADPSTLSPAH